MNDEKPLVSVTITTYNSENTINDVLNALLNQEYPLKRIEVIVIDGHSVDNTVDKVRIFMEKHRDKFYDFQLIIHDKNYGVSKARNDAIKLAKGRFIVILDSDVVLPPNAISKMVSFLEANPEVGCCRPLLEPDFMDILQRSLYDVNVGRIRRLMSCADAAMIRREIVEKAGLYDESMGPPFSVDEDLEFAARIWRAGYRCVLLGNVVAKHLTVKRDVHLAKIKKSVRGPKPTLATYIKMLINYFREKHARSWYKFLTSLPLKLRVKFIISSFFLPCLMLLLLGSLMQLPHIYATALIVLVASYLVTLIDFISSPRNLHKSMILAFASCMNRSMRMLAVLIYFVLKK